MGQPPPPPDRCGQEAGSLLSPTEASPSPYRSSLILPSPAFSPQVLAGAPFPAPRPPLWLAASASGAPLAPLPRTAFPPQVRPLSPPPWLLQTEPHLGEIEILDAPAAQSAPLSQRCPSRPPPPQSNALGRPLGSRAPRLSPHSYADDGPGRCLQSEVGEGRFLRAGSATGSPPPTPGEPPDRVGSCLHPQPLLAPLLGSLASRTLQGPLLPAKAPLSG